MSDVLPVARDDGYRGIWWYDTPSDDEYKYVYYSGGFATYTAKHIPLAYYAAEVDKTFFCWGGTCKDRNHLLAMVSYYDHASGTVPRPTILLDKGTADAHDNPVLMLDGDGFVWVFVSAHGTERPAYICRSREPYSTDAFELIQETNFSYPQPWFVPGNGFLFLHTRYRGGRFLYAITSPDGITWGEPVQLARMEHGHYQVSWCSGARVGTAFNYHPDAPAGLHRTNIYYMETADLGKTWKTVQGKVLSLPLETPDSNALVHDYEPEKQLVFVKDVNFDAAGNPVLLYLASLGIETGPKNDPRIWTTARWSGQRWEIREAFRSDNNYDTGGLHIEADGTWRIIAPTDPGPQPYNTGGEIVVWTSHDEGNSWDKARMVTKDSRYNHTYVRRPVNAHPDFYAFWADGDAREPSESRLYFCDKTGENVFRLPTQMNAECAAPERIAF